MISIYILIIIIIAFVLMFMSFLTYPVLIFLNIILIAVFFILIKIDLNKKIMIRHYLISMLLTAITLIFSNSGIIRLFFKFTKNVLFMSEIVVGLFFLYVYANISKFLFGIAKDVKKDVTSRTKKKLKSSKSKK